MSRLSVVSLGHHPTRWISTSSLKSVTLRQLDMTSIKQSSSTTMLSEASFRASRHIEPLICSKPSRSFHKSSARPNSERVKASLKISLSKTSATSRTSTSFSLASPWSKTARISTVCAR